MEMTENALTVKDVWDALVSWSNIYERICYDVKYHSADWMFFGIWTKLGFVFRWNKNGILFKGETIWNERHIGLNVTTITTLHEIFLENEVNLYRVHAERECLVN